MKVQKGFRKEPQVQGFGSSSAQEVEEVDGVFLTSQKVE